MSHELLSLRRCLTFSCLCILAYMYRHRLQKGAEVLKIPTAGMGRRHMKPIPAIVSYDVELYYQTSSFLLQEKKENRTTTNTALST
jgi:hypothetical protein